MQAYGQRTTRGDKRGGRVGFGLVENESGENGLKTRLDSYLIWIKMDTPNG